MPTIQRITSIPNPSTFVSIHPRITPSKSGPTPLWLFTFDGAASICLLITTTLDAQALVGSQVHGVTPLPSAPGASDPLLAAASDASDAEFSRDETLPAASSPSFAPAVDLRFMRRWRSQRSFARARYNDVLERAWRDTTLAEAELVRFISYRFERVHVPRAPSDRLALLNELPSALGASAHRRVGHGRVPRRRMRYLLLFPNEVYDRGGRPGVAQAKNAICALFCWSMLLAHVCGNVAGHAARGDVARDAGAPGHGCALRTTVVYLSREKVSNSVPERGHLPRYAVHPVPIPVRSAGTQRTWFHHQRAMCTLIFHCIRRVFCAAARISFAAVFKVFLVPREVMHALWACPRACPLPFFFPSLPFACTNLFFLLLAFLSWLMGSDTAPYTRLAAHCRSAGSRTAGTRSPGARGV
ncbi:hypothetical protein FB451DRAFT_1412031 [Mycena latifolia]|nr:hypothetical protein FB451DRAFT_1412031 [Mycena latifolia]